MKEAEENKAKEKGDPLKPYLKYSGLAFQMIGAMLLALWGGSKLDKATGNTQPIWTVVLLLVAVVASIYIVIVSVTKKP